MNRRVRVFAALLLLTFSRPAIGLPQDQEDKSKKNEVPKADQKKNKSSVSVKIKISAEDKSAIPAGSKVEWEGIGEGCTNITGEQNLRLREATPVSLPVCKVKLTVFITGFDTKTATVDLVGNEEKYANPIRIKVKRQGPAEVEW